MVFKPQRFFGEKPVVDTEIGNREPLETAVARLLAVSEGVDASDISVTATGSMVFLSGGVTWAEEIDRAVEVALSVPGVEKVNVDLVAEYARKPDDV